VRVDGGWWPGEVRSWSSSPDGWWANCSWHRKAGETQPALASMGAAAVRQFGSLYRQRAVQAARVGKFAGQAAYGPQIAAISSQLAAMNHKMDRAHNEQKSHPERTGREVARGVNSAASNAQRANR
jgi:hypothetical protein